MNTISFSTKRSLCIVDIKMVKIVHHITITVFEKNEERIQTIQKTFTRLLPIDFKDEKININHETAIGFHQKTIHILRLITNKNRLNNLVLKTLFDHLSNHDLKILAQQKESRIDDQGNFYIRLDKKALFDQQFILTEKGDCFHFKIKLAAFPATKQGYLRAVDILFHRFGSNHRDKIEGNHKDS